MNPEVAKKSALKKFGNVEALKDSFRESWGLAWLYGMVKDFTIGLRLLWKNKSFTAAVIFTLAICLEGNAVVFTILNTVLSPPPIPQSERLVQIYDVYPGIDGGQKGDGPSPTWPIGG